jgi:hypothetical protein
MVIKQLEGHGLSIQRGILCESGGRPGSTAYSVLRNAVRFIRGTETKFDGVLSISYEQEGEYFSVDLNSRSTRDTVKKLTSKALADASVHDKIY